MPGMVPPPRAAPLPARLFLLSLLCALLALVSGCGTLDEDFVRAVNANWRVMGPDYARYLAADEGLSEQSRTIRLTAVAEFAKLVDEAMAEVEGRGKGDGDGSD